MVVDVALVVVDEVVRAEVVVVGFTTLRMERDRRFLTTRRTARVVGVATDARVLATAPVATSFSRNGPTRPSATDATAIVARRRRRPPVTPPPPARVRQHATSPACH